MDHLSVHHLSAFTTDPSGGNPAGVWVGDVLPSEETMLEIAAEVGYSETVFAVKSNGQYDVRYFSPAAEVPFCGHATIALGVFLGMSEATGLYTLNTRAGIIPVDVVAGPNGPVATLTSVEPSSKAATPDLVTRALDALGWNADHLDSWLAPTVAFAGAHHLILATKTRAELADVNYDFDAMRELMLEADLTTVNLVWRQSPTEFQSRNLFPVGGVVEDPATGAAAAAFGGHLRSVGIAPDAFTVYQGGDMGRPSTLEVTVPAKGGISVTGTAVKIA